MGRATELRVTEPAFMRGAGCLLRGSLGFSFALPFALSLLFFLLFSFSLFSCLLLCLSFGLFNRLLPLLGKFGPREGHEVKVSSCT